MKKFKTLICATALITVVNSFSAVKPGLEVFLERYTHLVKGKRVGLITNATGVASDLTPTVDLLHQHPNINLKILMAPEHGIRGDLEAGEKFQNMTDPITKLPIHTLYGHKDHKPQPDALAQIDTIIYDIQDVGSRAYTFIWTLAEAMSAAAANDKTVIVFDRPNPMGATVVDGYVTEKKWLSFIGLYQIPRVYGMTVGELALLLNKEFNINCHLLVIPMQGYKRGMTWADTGLSWVPASPNIPNVDSAINFAATGTIGTLGNISIGIRDPLPFCYIAAPWINAEKTASTLNRIKLPGVKFRPMHLKPYNLIYEGKNIQGVQLHITDPAKYHPSTTEIVILYHLQNFYPSHFKFDPKKHDSFDKAIGTSLIRQKLTNRTPLKEILNLANPGITHFKTLRQKYLLYR